MMEGLAKVYVGQRRFKEAEDLLTRAAKLRVSIVGSEHVSMAGNWMILGVAYQAQGKGADAEKASREALRIVEKTTGTENSIVSNLLVMVAESCVMQGKHDTAADLYSRSVAMDEHILAPGPLRAQHLQGYANVLKAMGVPRKPQRPSSGLKRCVDPAAVRSPSGWANGPIVFQFGTV